MASEILLNTIRNVVAIDRAFTTGLQLGQTVYFSDPAASRILKVRGFSRPESDGQWIDSAQATIDLKLTPESVETGRLRLRLMPFVSAEKGQTLRLRCGEGPERVVEFSPGTLAWRMVDLPLAGVRADTFVRIQIAVAHMFVPAEMGLGRDLRTLGVKIRYIELLTDAMENLLPIAAGKSINLGSPDVRFYGSPGRVQRTGARRSMDRWHGGDYRSQVGARVDSYGSLASACYALRYR